MTRSAGPDNVLYPFPRFGASGPPVSVWLMMGIGAGTQEPKVTYDALRALDRNTQRVANVPAQRMSPGELQRLFPIYRDDAAQMVVGTMQNASYVTIDRPQWGAFVTSSTPASSATTSPPTKPSPPSSTASKTSAPRLSRTRAATSGRLPRISYSIGRQLDLSQRAAVWSCAVGTLPPGVMDL